MAAARSGFYPELGGSEYLDRILFEQCVGRQHMQLVLQCLADQHPIKWIAMMKWQPKEMRQRRLVEWKSRNIVLFTPRSQIFICRRRKWQLAELMFRKRFPDGYDAQEDLVRFILNSVGRRKLEVADHPLCTKERRGYREVTSFAFEQLKYIFRQRIVEVIGNDEVTLCETNGTFARALR